MSKQTEDFNVQLVPLAGKNLIEASAGTGKTYSVAIMVLRLILEKDIHIREVLMVTFTKAAVAELEERIRRFIRLAARYASGEEIDDPTIKGIVDKVESEKGIDFVREKLHSAVINLDETAVMTIHSFCQQTLTEFAFETNQLFNAELLQDMGSIMEETVKKFWREKITSLRPDILKELHNQSFSQASIKAVVDSHLDGKIYFAYSEEEKYQITEEKYAEIQADAVVIANEADKIHQSIVDEITANWDEILAKCEANTYVRDKILPKAKDSATFLNLVIEKRTLANVKKTLPDILEKYNPVLEAHQKIELMATDFLDYAYCAAIQEITKEVERKKIQLNQMTFDDVITKLYFALNHNSSNKSKQRLQNDLIRGLQWKYKAVFIDEFQDTDKLQYQIFNKAFGENTIVFYIGDPKQSIYAWRKADIETYFEAKRNVDRIYSMRTNFRSSENLVSALNRFFEPIEDFDTFLYKNDSKDPLAEIRYIKVDTPMPGRKGEMTVSGEPCVPVKINCQSKNDAVFEEAIKQVSELLNNPEYAINNRSIRPSDIGILVRKRKDAAAIQSGLSRIGIPAVTVTDSRILQSAEAAELVYVLEAVLNQSQSAINRALTTSFFNWKPDEILSLNEDVVIQRFKGYLISWEQNGIYAALSNLINEFDIQQNLIGSHTENGERIITNLYHLMEVLYRTANRQHFGPPELLDWLKINISKPESNDDEMIQRIESDEEAVRITTIHSSKGLEYNIVIAPYLDFVIRSKKEDKDKVISYRNSNEDYVSVKRIQTDDEAESLYLKQSEQENRRLLYVALTRAVYACYIYRNTHYKNKSTLFNFTSLINFEETKGLIEEIPSLEIENPLGYQPEQELEQYSLTAGNFDLSHKNWTQTSYSRLAAQPEYVLRKNYELNDNEYDSFVFKELTKGAKTGNFIHHIFENVDFADSGKWEFVIERAIKQFVPDKKEKYPNALFQFLEKVLHTEIRTGTEQFKLSDISSNELLHEMEFDFPMELFSIKSLEKLKENGIIVKNPEEYPQQIEGIMTGFVDLFFRHNGKFYVLDWKTNYLGPKVGDYSRENVAKAMTANNYHLQYLIYSYAVKLYLEHRLGDAFDFERDFGGVVYLFVRGMRTGEDSGIFFTKPSLEQMRGMGEVFGS